ncbi:MAG TPA: DUF4326 domain-containing protein [Candidatus Udaeobacter sp.]|nr:DUF4326 domain-containing protein [Candidatus Udaeobacter sp.]
MTATVTLPKVVNISVRKGNTGADHRPAPSLESGIVYVGDYCSQGGWSLRRHPLYNHRKDMIKAWGLEEVLRVYRERLHSRTDLLAEAWALRDVPYLGCWCAPEPCHCDLIIEAIALMAAGVIPIPGS